MSVQTQVEPLRAGDWLTREEFIQRWNDIPDLKRAELIGGIVYMPSPLSAGHGRSDARVQLWLGYYAAHTPGCEAGANATWYMLMDAPQPDGHLRIIQEYGGSSWEEEIFFHGAPELIVETSLSSSSYDLHQKKELYQAAGVEEYIVILLNGPAVRWHRLVGHRYQEFQITPEGIIKSVVFPGLWLKVDALLTGNSTKLLETLELGLASTEHAEFVDELARRRT